MVEHLKSKTTQAQTLMEHPVNDVHSEGEAGIKKDPIFQGERDLKIKNNL